jgi:hypothetical protein
MYIAEDSINRYMMERIMISVVEALFVHIQDGGDIVEEGYLTEQIQEAVDQDGYCRRGFLNRYKMREIRMDIVEEGY